MISPYNNNQRNYKGFRLTYLFGIITMFCLITLGCAKLGTKTLFRLENGEIPVIRKIVLYTPLTKDDMNVEPEIAQLMLNSAIDYCRESEYQIAQSLETEYLGYENPSQDKIRAICVSNNLDGLIVSRISFTNHVYSTYGIAYASIIDTEVSMKLFDSTGILLVETLHNTHKGNSYAFAPSLETTVKDGTVGALKRIFKEMKEMKTSGST